MNRKTIITTCTRDCPNTCGLLATVEDGRLVRLAGDPAHPLTRGSACVKCGRYVQRVYDPERVTCPLIRGADGHWRRSSWDEALDLVAARMTAIRDQSGPEAILYYQGYGERTALKLLNKYFFNLFGGVTTLRGSLCGGTGQASQNLDFGVRVSHDPLDHLNSRSMVLWARNPVSTNISLVPIIREIRKRGGRVILVDPARSKSAALADRHILPRPGRDAGLALAAARLILQAGAEDRGFLENHSVGAAEFLALLERFTVDQLCDLAGVSRADAEYLAETLLEQKPTSMLLGWGLHRHEYAHHSIRAIDALGAVAGTIGVPGGGVSQGFEEYGPYDQRFWGDGLNPPRRTLLLPKVGEEILAARDPEIRMIFVTAGNPLCMAPNSGRTAEAFRKAEFVVYSGHFLDDTADHAHVFLPATTFLEENDAMASYGHNYLGPVNPAIAPVGRCRSEFRMFHDLAGRFPFAARFQRSEEDWLRDLLAPMREHGLEPENLRQGAFRCPAPMTPYADRRFETESGKFQFMTGFDPAELSGQDPDHPFRLLTVAPHGYICSERTMAGHEALPAARLHPDEAARLGLAEGQVVLVRSAVGQARAVLRLEADMRRDVLVAERGGWTKAGHGLNRLTRDLASKVGQGMPYYETAVSVGPLPDGEAEQQKILVLQHSKRAPGANFCKELERRGAVLTTLWPGKGEALPAEPEGFAGLVVLGGPQHAFDDRTNPHFPPLLALMRAFDQAGKPVAGICLGSQLLARAHGAGVRSMGDLEFGFTELAAEPAAKADPVLGPALPAPRAMEYHEDSFDLPEGAVLLLRGQACAHQAFRVGRASYGFQFHPEVDARIVAAWAEALRSEDLDKHPGLRQRFNAAYFADLTEELPLLIARSEAFCRAITRNWLTLAKDEPRSAIRASLTTP